VSPFFSLIVGILCVWRVTHLLNAEDGPGDIFVRFRRLLGSGIVGQLFDCFYCLSLWVALPFSLWLADLWRERILFCLAFSGGACLLERFTQRAGGEFPAAYAEDVAAREHHVVLRESQESVQDAQAADDEPNRH
jgi:Protein of unknown function (DUF1360)